MAVTIPIFPGSSSFATGSTSFNYFDTDPQFVADADKAALWAARRLGFPITDVELQDIHFWDAFEEATAKYGHIVNAYNLRDYMLYIQGVPTGSNLTQVLITPSFDRTMTLTSEYGTEAGTGGTLTWRKGSIPVTASVQDYDLNAWAEANLTGALASSSIEIKRVFHYAPPAIVRYFDPFVGTGLGQQQLLDAFGFGNYSPGVSFLLMPVYADILRLQAIELNDQIRRSNYTFEVKNNRVRLFPIPGRDSTLWFEYIIKEERLDPERGQANPTGSVVSDFSNANYGLIPYQYINSIGKRWIYDYMLAICKEMLGLNRGKYNLIPIPNAEASLNAPDLLQQAQQEKEQLILKLEEHMMETSRTRQLEKQKEDSMNLNETMMKIPLPFKIG